MLIAFVACLVVTVIYAGLLIYLVHKEPNTDALNKAARRISRAADKASRAADRIPKNQYRNPFGFFSSFFHETWTFPSTVTLTQITTTCLHCGKRNRLRSTDLKGARCGYCRRDFLPNAAEVN